MTVREIHELISEHVDTPKSEFIQMCLDELTPQEFEDLSLMMEICSGIKKMAFEHGFKQGVRAGAEDFKQWLIDKNYSVPDATTDEK